MHVVHVVRCQMKQVTRPHRFRAMKTKNISLSSICDPVRAQQEQVLSKNTCLFINFVRLSLHVTSLGNNISSNRTDKLYNWNHWTLSNCARDIEKRSRTTSLKHMRWCKDATTIIQFIYTMSYNASCASCTWHLINLFPMRFSDLAARKGDALS